MIALALTPGCSRGVGGCTLASVDEAAYVKQNEAVLRTVPVPPAARRINSYSIGIPSLDACFPGENGPPYSAYDTWHVYRPPSSWGPNATSRFFRRELASKWSGEASSGSDVTFRRGLALLYVRVSPGTFALSIDYRGYAGRGH